MNVMITGAGRGIGLELVRYFASRPDCRVFAVSRNEKIFEDFYAFKSPVFPVLANIEDVFDDPEIILDQINEKDFRLDILINNAGFLINKSFLDFQNSEIERIFRINCFAPAALIKALMPYMAKDRKSHVVNISSMGGFQGSVKFPGLSWYSASKAALACLTECLNEEFKTSGVVFNCLALGSVQTEMLSEAFPGYKAPVNPDEMAEFIGNFALTAHRYIRGKVIPVSLSTP